MDILEIWELTYFALVVVLMVAIARRSPMPSKESAASEQFEQLTKRIKSLRHVFAAAMTLTLYQLFDLLPARGDRMEIAFAIILASIFLVIGGHHLWRVRQCVRLRRQLTPAAERPSLPEGEVDR